jgi:uncharacterized protein YecE (DUF72 family)
MQVRIGISGWTYTPWRGVFYPPGLPQKRELEFASRQLNSIEINGSFYSLQTPASYKNWFDQTPKGFAFAVKGGQFITHMRRLRDVRIPLANFFASGVLRLNEKLGPILWQLPPNFKFEADRVEPFFKLLPSTTKLALTLAREHQIKIKEKVWLKIDADRPLRNAIEVRNETFQTKQFVSLATQNNIAIVIADSANDWPVFDQPTPDFFYARLHGHEETYRSGYDSAALDQWAKRIKQWRKRRDVYVYFDNDQKVHSPRDAIALSQRLAVKSTVPKAD